jgi:hypothetical protein
LTDDDDDNNDNGEAGDFLMRAAEAVRAAADEKKWEKAREHLEVAAELMARAGNELANLRR